MATSLFDVLSSLQVTADEVIQAESFAEQYLSTLYPDIDFRSGLAQHDLVIRPTATLIALVNKGLSSYFSQNTISGITDATPEDIVDGLMSNFFLSRRQGSKTTIAARLFFLQRKAVRISQSYYFSPDNIRFFYPVQAAVFSANDMEFDPGSDRWYVDIDLTAASVGSEYDLGTGSLLYFTVFDPYFSGANILYLKSASVAKETNLEFKSRASSAISTRNLVNEPSITQALEATFNYISHVSVIGYGDSRMLRDLGNVQVGSFPAMTVHLGGKVDAYCFTPITSQIKQFITDSSGDVLLTGDHGAVIRIVRSEVPETGFSNDDIDTYQADPVHNTPVSFTVSCDNYDGLGVATSYNSDVGFSSRNTVKVSFGAPHANKTVTLKLYKFAGMSSIQAYLDARGTRVVCADYLARGHNVYAFAPSIKWIGDSSPDVDTLAALIRKFFNDKIPGDTITKAEFVAYLFDNGFEDISPDDTTLGYQYYRNNFVTSLGGTLVDTLTLSEIERATLLDDSDITLT